MRSPALPAVLACCLLLAGCASVAVPLPAESGPTTASSPAKTIAPGTESPVGSVPGTSPRRTDVPQLPESPAPASADNPWGRRTVVVNATDGQGRVPAIRPVVERTLRYWARNDGRYADYSVNFSYRPAAEQAGVTIRYVENVSRCGPHVLGRPLGCAPRLAADATPPRPVVVAVRADRPPAETALTLRHEFGHVLGIDHGEPPMPLMARSNLHAKAAPWDRQDIAVAVVAGDGDGVTPVYRRQVGHALAYYSSGAEGFVPPETVGFRWVDRRAAANVVVVLEDDVPHNDDPYSTMRTVNGTVDGTVYRRTTITLFGVDGPAAGWHAGYWLGHALGAPDRTALPPAFREGDAAHSSSRWWR